MADRIVFWMRYKHKFSRGNGGEIQHLGFVNILTV